MNSIGLVGAITDNIEAQLTPGILHPMISITLWRLQHLGHLGHKRSLWHIIQTLTDNLGTFHNLLKANYISIPVISSFAYWNIKIQLAINTIFINFANIVIPAAGSYIGARHAKTQGILLANNGSPLHTLLENLIARKQSIVLIQHFRYIIDKFLSFLQKFILSICNYTANANIMTGHTGTANNIEQIQNLFSITESINHTGGRA